MSAGLDYVVQGNLDMSKQSVCYGANLTLSPSTTMACSSAGMLSSSGRCKTFDASADGYVRAEATAGIKIRAKEAGNNYVRICAAAVNQDGKSSSLTAPNGPAQARVIRQALGSSFIDEPSRITSLSCHGTGTALGDPIEVGAAVGILRGHFARSNTENNKSHALVLGALKSSKGHSESASGMLAITTIIQAYSKRNTLSHGIVMHLSEMNRLVAGTPESANTCPDSSLPFSTCRQDLAPSSNANHTFTGISAFGFTGTNAHAIVSGDEFVGFLTKCDTGSYAHADMSRFWVLPRASKVLGSLVKVNEIVRTVSKERCTVLIKTDASHITVSDVQLPSTSIASISSFSARLIGWRVGFGASENELHVLHKVTLMSNDQRATISARCILDVHGAVEFHGTYGSDYRETKILSVASIRLLDSHSCTKPDYESRTSCANTFSSFSVLFQNVNAKCTHHPRAYFASVFDANASYDSLELVTHALETLALIYGSRTSIHLIDALICNPEVATQHRGIFVGYLRAHSLMVRRPQGIVSVNIKSAQLDQNKNTDIQVLDQIVPKSGWKYKSQNETDETRRKFVVGEISNDENIRSKMVSIVNEVVGSMYKDIDNDCSKTELGGDPLTLIETGIDSLGVTELCAAIRRTFPTFDLPSTALYDCSTVDDIVELVTKCISESTARTEPEVLTEKFAASCLTREQYLFWSHSLMFPNSCAYNMGFVLHFQNELSIDTTNRIVLQAIKNVISAHPSLLVRVSSDGTSQIQPTAVNWKNTLGRATRIHELKSCGDDGNVTLNTPALADACARPFDIVAAPPLRFYSVGNYSLVLVAHHILCDASSLTILANQIRSEFDSIKSQQVNAHGKITRLKPEYGFFIHATRQTRQSVSDLAEKLDHWETYLTHQQYQNQERNTTNTSGNTFQECSSQTSLSSFSPLDLKLDYEQKR